MTEDDESDERDEHLERTPGRGEAPAPAPIEPSTPDDFGLVQVWWGDGKGKTTAALGMGFRAAGHGYRVHAIQFMKGGASSVEPHRGEYNAIDAMPGFTVENTGHYGWHGLPDGSDDDEHAARAQAAFDRAREIADASRNLPDPPSLNGSPDEGCHLLILDEILYATNRELIDPDSLREFLQTRPEDLEIVLTGGHEEPTYVYEHADLVTEARKIMHPIDEGQRARKGTEF
ncbi:MAG: cob(I)yrinic acid a,c-diamide adenosyltransferase [Halodesulfurarchaeum sp.]